LLLRTITENYRDTKSTYKSITTIPYNVRDTKSSDKFLSNTENKFTYRKNTRRFLTITPNKLRLKCRSKWSKSQTNYAIFDKLNCFLPKRYIFSIFIILYLSLIALMITLPGEIHKASFLDFLLKIFNCIIKCIEISGDSFLENDYFLDPDLLRDKESLNPMLSLYGVWVMLWDKYINYRKEMLNISNKGNFSKPEVVYTPDFETSLLSEEPELGDNMPEKNIVSDDNTEMTRKHITGYGRKMFLGFLGIGILVLVATFGLCEPIININLFEYIHGVDHTFYFANIVLNRYLLNIFASNDFIMSKFMI